MLNNYLFLVGNDPEYRSEVLKTLCLTKTAFLKQPVIF
jgi:hypothetical protein